MKKILAILLALTLAATMLAGCGDTIEETPNTPETPVTGDVTLSDVPDVSEETTAAEEEVGEKWNGKDIKFVSDNGIQYIWDQLEDDVKSNLADVMNAIAEVEPFCPLSVGIPEDELVPFLELVINCSMDYDYVLPKFRPHDSDGDGNVDAITINFNLDVISTAEEGWALTDQLNNKLAEVVAGMPVGTEYERIKYLHDYLVFNCTYSEDASLPFTAYGALVEQKATCQGYADAMHLLLNRAGFETVYCIGIGNSELVTHKWNYVKLSDGQWYIIDPTWSDPANKDDPNYICYDYFLISDEVLLMDHQQKNESIFYTTPTATSMDMSYHVQEGYYCTTFDEAYAAAEKQAALCVQNGTKYIYLRMSDPEVFTEVRNGLLKKSEGGKIGEILEKAVEGTDSDINPDRWATYAGYDEETGKGPYTLIVTLYYNSDP